MSGADGAAMTPPSVQVSRRRNLGFVQSLRAMAALMVAISHIIKEMFDGHPNSGGFVLREFMQWQYGVDVFFIISGFIMYFITDGRAAGRSDARLFAMRRLVRIVPLYWVFTTAFLLISLSGQENLHHQGLSLYYVAASYFFIPAYRPGTNDLSPLMALGWTLNYEMMFYGIFTLLILLSVRRTLGPLILILFGLSLFALLIPPEVAPLWYWSRNIIIEFIFGAVIAHLFRANMLPLPLWVGIAAILTGTVIWQATGLLWQVTHPGLNIRGLTWGIAATLMVGGVALTPRIVDFIERPGQGGDLIRTVGDASYSLYLVHMFAVRAVALLFLKAFHTTITPLFPVVALAGAIAAALLSYRYIEKPAIAFGRRYLNG